MAIKIDITEELNQEEPDILEKVQIVIDGDKTFLDIKYKPNFDKRHQEVFASILASNLAKAMIEKEEFKDKLNDITIRIL